MAHPLVDLVACWGRYEAEQPNLSIEDFCVRYLAEQAAPQRRSEAAFEAPLNGLLAGLLGRMTRFAEVYSKKALEHLDLNNNEDWVYLLCLLQPEPPTKSELINQMLAEVPSGFDVIRRLVKRGLVEEFPDPTDKRSKRIRLTAEGQQFLWGAMPYIEKIGEMAFDSLSDAEKRLLANLLQRLDAFHTQHYRQVRASDFGAAYELLTPKK
jgi:DNA-binding MarR family transcriptional regulator